jgi:hypothetical protein
MTATAATKNSTPGAPGEVNALKARVAVLEKATEHAIQTLASFAKRLNVKSASDIDNH